MFKGKEVKSVLLAIIFCISVIPVSAQAGREFHIAALQAGQSDRWKAINWQPNMEAAKSAAFRQRKPILVVLHNNFGGDSHSTEC